MMTDAERKLWRYLRSLPAAATHFRRQATIGRYFADFARHTSRLVIEVDGGQHGQPDRIVHDAARTAYLASRGYRVLRFWNNEVLGNIDGVMTLVRAALLEAESLRPPPPTPPGRATRGGRGAERP